MKSNVVQGIDLSDTASRADCQSCLDGKQTKTTSMLSAKYTEIGDVTFSDVCEPFDSPSWSNATYCLRFIDGALGYVSVSTIEKKSEITKIFISFKEMLDSLSNNRIKRLHTDNGGEYLNENLKPFFDSQKIFLTKTSPCSAQSNGTAERMNRTLLNKVRSKLLKASLNKKFWAEAVHRAVYLEKMLPSGDRRGTPIKTVCGTKPHAGYLKVFGCLVHEAVPDSQRRKLEHKSRKLIHIGHISPTISRGYCLSTGRVHVVCHGKFDETAFLGTSSTPRNLRISNEGGVSETEGSMFQENFEIDFSDDEDESKNEITSHIDILDMYQQLPPEHIPLHQTKMRRDARDEFGAPHPGFHL